MKRNLAIPKLKVLGMHHIESQSEVSESSQVEEGQRDIRVPSAPNESRGSSRNNSSTSFPPPHPLLPHLGSHYFIMFLLIMLILLIPLRQIHLHFIMFIHSIILQLLLLPRRRSCRRCCICNRWC